MKTLLTLTILLIILSSCASHGSIAKYVDQDNNVILESSVPKKHYHKVDTLRTVEDYELVKVRRDEVKWLCKR